MMSSVARTSGFDIQPLVDALLYKNAANGQFYHNNSTAHSPLYNIHVQLYAYHHNYCSWEVVSSAHSLVGSDERQSSFLASTVVVVFLGSFVAVVVHCT